MAGGRTPRLVHRPRLVARNDGRFEVRCDDCRVRMDEEPPVGLNLPVASKHEAVEMLKNHIGKIGWRAQSQVLPAPEAPPSIVQRPRPAAPARRIRRTA